MLTVLVKKDNNWPEDSDRHLTKINHNLDLPLQKKGDTFNHPNLGKCLVEEVSSDKDSQRVVFVVIG